MERYWIGLGANLGDRRTAIQAALERLAAAGHDVEAVSGLYETAPRDLADQPPFLNAAARVRSALGPRDMLAALKALEAGLGRDPGGVRFGPRAVDCDILLREGGPWRDEALEIPHPRLAERRSRCGGWSRGSGARAPPGGELSSAVARRRGVTHVPHR